MDLIERNKVIEVSMQYCPDDDGTCSKADKDIRELLDELEAIPAADVVPVVHSQWKYKCGEIQCPECGNRIHRIDLSGCLNFCPNCGAKMDGGES